MIYRNSYFSKELRQAYIENTIGVKRKLTFAFFLGLFSFIVHFILQIMTESVVADAVPYLMQESYFSTVYTYIAVAFFLYVLYYIVFYEYLSFEELRKNRWYLLVKLGYQPLNMILAKLAAALYSIFTIYSIGFVLIIVLTVFLKYYFVYAYLPSLYLVGLIDLIVVTVIAMTLSLYIRNKTTARYAVCFSALALLVPRVALGYHALVTDRILMQDPALLFDFSRSLYLPVMALVVLLCLTVCVLRARNVAKYYSVPYDLYGYVLSETETVVRINERSGKAVGLVKKDSAGRRGRILDLSVVSFLTVFICGALAFNLFIILNSAVQPGKEVTIRGTIPYVFKSDTMEPTIMENDLAYFKRIDAQTEPEIGDIVLFMDKNVVYVERVTAREDSRLVVDIDYYPPMSQVGAMEKTVDSSAVYGIYTHSSRWLGALILFANTILGRLVFLLLPAILLFYYQHIKNFFTNMSHKTSFE